MEGCARRIRKRMLCDLSCCSCQKCKRYRDNEKGPGVAINFERWNACSRSNQPSVDMPWTQAHSDDRPWWQSQSDDRPWWQSYSDDRPWWQSHSDDKQWSPSQLYDRLKFQIRKETMDVNLPVDAQAKANEIKSFEADNPLSEPDSSSNLPSKPNSNFTPKVRSIAKDTIRSNLPNFIKNSINSIKPVDSKEYMSSFLRKIKANDPSGGGESQSTSFGGILADIVRAMATTQVIVLSLVFLLTLNLWFEVMERKTNKNSSAIRVSQKAKKTSPCKDKVSSKTTKPRISPDVPCSACRFLKSYLPRQTGGACLQKKKVERACPQKKKEEKKSNSILSWLSGPRCRITCPPGTPKTYSFCAKFADNCPQRQAKKHRRYKRATKAVNTAISDCQGKEIYKIYEKRSYPLDLKFPPAPFIYIRDCILRRVCPRSPEEAERQDCA
uniref:Uncharacterized protein n=1 Tax=Glossina austeni TaxID=7395 RepID=A0A1A9UUH5_GLOAU